MAADRLYLLFCFLVGGAVGGTLGYAFRGRNPFNYARRQLCLLLQARATITFLAIVTLIVIISFSAFLFSLFLFPVITSNFKNCYFLLLP